MILSIITVFLSLTGLMVLHEFGHFIIAKKYGVKVEEFGLGYPPRLFGKKIGETLYSVNLIPFGAFVKLFGEEKEVKDKRSFTGRPIWQRAFIVLGGVLSFWIIAAILLSLVVFIGAPYEISDEEAGVLRDPRVQIIAVSANSPAQGAGLQVGDTIREIKIENVEYSGINKVKEVQDILQKGRGKEIILTTERGNKMIESSVLSRENPPPEEGAVGIGLARTAIKSSPWYKAPWLGIKATFNTTFLVILGWYQVIAKLFAAEPTGVQFLGPVGIFDIMRQRSEMGINYYLHFIAIISIYLAVFNLLPIPALDGGKLLFLGIEKIKKRPVSPEFEQKITTVFFLLLISLMILVTIKDIKRIF